LNSLVRILFVFLRNFLKDNLDFKTKKKGEIRRTQSFNKAHIGRRTQSFNKTSSKRVKNVKRKKMNEEKDSTGEIMEKNATIVRDPGVRE